MENYLIKLTNILKTKINNRKTNPHINKGEISRCNFCRSKFNKEKNCADAAEKPNND